MPTPLIRPIIVSLSLFGLTACAHYSVQAPEPNPAGQTHSVTLTSYFWGAVEQQHNAPECDATHSLDMVRVEDNLGYDFLSVITLGIVKPMKIEYRCSAGQTPVGPAIGE